MRALISIEHEPLPEDWGTSFDPLDQSESCNLHSWIPIAQKEPEVTADTREIANNALVFSQMRNLDNDGLLKQPFRLIARPDRARNATRRNTCRNWAMLQEKRSVGRGFVGTQKSELLSYDLSMSAHDIVAESEDAEFNRLNRRCRGGFPTLTFVRRTHNYLTFMMFSVREELVGCIVKPGEMIHEATTTRHLTDVAVCFRKI